MSTSSKIALTFVLCLGVFAVWQGVEGPQEGAEATTGKGRLSDSLFAKKAAGTYVSKVASSWADHGMTTLGADGTLLWQGSAYHGRWQDDNVISAAQGNWKRSGRREVTGTVCLFSNNVDPTNENVALNQFETWVLFTSVVTFNEDFTEMTPYTYVWYFHADTDDDGDVDHDDISPWDPEAVPFFDMDVGSGGTLYRLPIWEF